jgi:hypothetical protein
MSAETSCSLSSGAAGQEPMPWRFLATTAIVCAYSSLGLNSTTWVPGRPDRALSRNGSVHGCDASELNRTWR